MANKEKIEIIENSESLNRPAWTSTDWFAFNHKHTAQKRFGNDVRPAIIPNYYQKSGGLQ